MHAAFQINIGVVGIGHAQTAASCGGQMGLETHPIFAQELDFAVQPIAAQVHQFAPSLLHPILNPLVHLARPILRVDADNQNLVGIEIKVAVVELPFRVVIIGKAFALQPAEEPPFGRGHATR